MAFAPGPLVPPIVRQPLPYGLFSVVTFRTDITDVTGWQNGVQWTPGTCEPLDGLGAPTCDPSENPEKNLDPNGGGTATATPFTVYGHFSCSALGYTYETATAQAQAHLVSREQARVEQALWTGDLGNTPALAKDAETLNVDASPYVALAALESYIATQYGSLGIIHMSRGLASSLTARGLLKVTGGSLVTAIGTPVVAGAGYPGTGPDGKASTLGPGAEWAYASPALMGYQSEIFAPQDETGGWINSRHNDITALAERTYVLGYDPCGVAAVQINPAA